LLVEPTDFIGKILAMMINKQLESPATLSEVEKWQMTVVLQTDFYPLSLIFDDTMRIEKGVSPEPTLLVTTTFNTIIRIAKGESSLIKSVLGRSIRIKGLFRHPIATFRFYRLMNVVLKG
jgi:hypothetical protein